MRDADARPALLAGLSGLVGCGFDLLKLLAAVLMLGDHVNTIFFGRENIGLYVGGRLAFPLFAIVYAANVRLDAKYLSRAATRAFIYALIAQPIYLVAFWNSGFAPWYGLNVLFSFAASSFICLLWLSEKTARKIAAALIFLIFGSLLEPGSYGFSGLAMILAGVIAFNSKQFKSRIFFLAWWLLLIKITFYHWFLSLLILVMTYCVMLIFSSGRHYFSRFGRFFSGGFFYLFYIAHLFIFTVLHCFIY